MRLIKRLRFCISVIRMARVPALQVCKLDKSGLIRERLMNLRTTDGRTNSEHRKLLMRVNKMLYLQQGTGWSNMNVYG